MLEELRNKNVKIMVGSNSGIATAVPINPVTSIMTVIGTFIGYDDKMIKISNAEINGVTMKGSARFGFGTPATYESVPEKYQTVYININEIITIATIEE